MQNVKVLGPMRRSSLTRRISDLNNQIKSYRTELGITEEQLLVLQDQRDDAKTRAIVSETPLASREYQEAERTYSRFKSYRDELREKIAELVDSQDNLLEKLASAKDD